MQPSENSPVLGDIGEQGLLKLLHQFCTPGLVGDDAACLELKDWDRKSLVVTTDVLVDGVHFSEKTTSPEDAGWRAAAANLSDLAAMGASAIAIVVGLSLKSDTPVSWVERLYQGMTACLEEYDTAIAGGDVVRSPVITIAITAFGRVDPERTIRRGAAKPGDAIVVTGYHGASRAGLELLLHPELRETSSQRDLSQRDLSQSNLSQSNLSQSNLSQSNLSQSDRNFFIQAHQRPRPRLDVLPILQNLNSANSPDSSNYSAVRIAGMDSSDGLADAIFQIARASGCGARIDRAKLPIPEALSQWVGVETALDWALYGGEDFELVLCLPSESAEELVKKLGSPAAIVGTITKDTGICLTDSTGAKSDRYLSLDKGFEHF